MKTDGGYLIEVLARAVELGGLHLASKDTMKDLVGPTHSFNEIRDLGEHFIALGKRINEHVLETCNHSDIYKPTANETVCYDCGATREYYSVEDEPFSPFGENSWTNWSMPAGFRWPK